MGLDLSLCPLQHGNKHFHEAVKQNDGFWFLAFTRLALYRDYPLFSQLGADRHEDPPDVVLNTHDLPDSISFDWYGDSGIATQKMDSYESKLTYVLAGDFKKLNLKENTHEWNVSVINFIRSLAEDTPVVLWWS
jgi:hypothetical protein